VKVQRTSMAWMCTRDRSSRVLWTGTPVRCSWLRAQRFDDPVLLLSYEGAYDAMLACVDRRNRLDDAITAMAADSEFTPVVHRLGCIRGVAVLTAFGLAVETGDWHRLTGRASAPTSLVPSEHSSETAAPKAG
jgi:transposase